MGDSVAWTELSRISIDVVFTSGGVTVEMGDADKVDFKGEFGKHCDAVNEILDAIVEAKEAIEKNCRDMRDE